MPGSQARLRWCLAGFLPPVLCVSGFFQVPKDLTYGFKLVFGAPVSGAMGIEVSATRQCDEGFGFRDCLGSSLDAVAQLAQSAVLDWAHAAPCGSSGVSAIGSRHTEFIR